MENSAKNEDGGLRERKRLITRSAICDTARRLTIDKGLSGFTVEELCEQVGISRRTFFNYFPTKEDAVLGHSEDHQPKDLTDAFLASAGSVPLLTALAELAASTGERLAITREEFAQMHALMQREPQLLVKLFGDSAVRHKEFAALIARREGMTADDPRAAMAAELIGRIAWLSTHAFFRDEESQSYRDILESNIDAAGYLFNTGAPHHTPEGTP
ncbi:MULTISPECIES: TetR/AcrR family transcriptional regulator [unclassified Arthrobacter]|uniref:TetR/AcrR family transcriptional regulator n=1 Tax=unclassified Arthrobacter TaxID=235627 RepID=UPI001491CE39|nr:TetR/AcrR family transcriptional regulator [Arthrobacter sp. AET 35A]NOJ60812.1 TetR/AcrR family transcriptional regulator [Arthrobacter sp. 260]NOJ62858.1 TetR/AcrR family transcriptional regulator [Arthrobacter sp. 147(2020)]